MANLLPELGSGGWVRDPQSKIALLFGHALASDYSQSNVYHGSVTSIPFIIAQYQDKVDVMVTEMESALKVYYGRYFADSSVTVRADEQDTGFYRLIISVEVVENNKTYSLAIAGKLSDGKLVDIIQEVNR